MPHEPTPTVGLCTNCTRSAPYWSRRANTGECAGTGLQRAQQRALADVVVLVDLHGIHQPQVDLHLAVDHGLIGDRHQIVETRLDRAGTAELVDHARLYTSIRSMEVSPAAAATVG